MADAQFIFETNINTVASEIENGLKRIASASSTSQAPASTTFLDDLTAKIRRQVEGAVREIRKLEAEYRQLGRGGGSLTAGQPNLSAAVQNQLRSLFSGINTTVTGAASRRPSELASLDLAKLSADVNKYLGDSFVSGIRQRLRGLGTELGPQAASIIGNPANIRTDRALSGGAGGAGRPPTPPAPPASPPPPPRPPLPSAAELRAQKQRDEEERRRQLARDLLPLVDRNNSGVGYLRNTPGSAARLFDDRSGAPKFFKRFDTDQLESIDPRGDYVEWHAAMTDYIVRLKYLANLAQKKAEQDQKDLQAQGALQAKAQREDTTRAERERKRLEQERNKLLDSEIKLLRERIRTQEKQGQSGIIPNFLGGLTSTGFGGGGGGGFNLDGIAKSAGISAKYFLIGQALFALQGAAQQAVEELLNADDSVTELEVAMGSGAKVTGEFTGRLQDFAAEGGFNVGEAMDVAASGIRTFKDDIAGTSQSTEDLGTAFAKQANRIAVISKTTLTDAGGNLKAITSGFDLSKSDVGFARVADAIAGAKQFGGNEKDIGQGLANSALIFKEMGFSVEEAASIISKIVAETDQSGQLVATRLSRISAIIGGTAGKKAISELNGQLAPQDQVDTTASLRDQTVQLSAAYQKLSDSQKQVLNSQLGGSANQRELIVLLQSLNGIVGETNKGFANKAAEEYAKRLEHLRTVLKGIAGQISGITVNVANSGAFDPLIAAVEALRPALTVVRDLTSAFNELPRPIRTVGFAILEVLAAMKAIRAVQGAGGIRAIFGGEGGAAAANKERLLGRLDSAIAAERRSIPVQWWQDTPPATPRLNALLAERARVERELNTTVVSAAVRRQEAERAGAVAAASGGSAFGRMMQASSDAQWKVIGAARGAVASRFVAARDALYAGLEETPFTFRGAAGLAGRGLSSAGRGIVGGLTSVAGAAARGAGALAAGIGPIGGALLGLDLALQIKSGADEITRAERDAADELRKGTDTNSAALEDSAKTLRTAAANIDQASSGFIGSIADFFKGGSGERRAADLKAVADQRDADARRIKEVESGLRSGKTGVAGFAQSIDITSAQTVTDSFKALEDEGTSASQRLQALSLVMQRLDFATTGTVRSLSDAQQLMIAIGSGSSATGSLANIISGIETRSGSGFKGNVADANRFLNRLTFGLTGETVDPKVAALSKVDRGAVARITQATVADQLSKGVNLDSKEGIEGFKKVLQAQYESILIDPETAATLADEVARGVAKDVENRFTPQTPLQILKTTIAQGISESAGAAQDVVTKAQMQALLSGGQDKSGVAGAKAQRDALAGVRRDADAKLREGIAAGSFTREEASQALLPLIIAQNEAEVRFRQSIIQQADADIAVMEEERQAQQKRAKGAAQVKAIGEEFLNKEVNRALVARDTEALIKILSNANEEEVKTIRASLAAVIAVERQAIEGARRALAAAAAFGGGSGGVGYTGGAAIQQYQAETQKALAEKQKQLEVLDEAIKRSTPDTKGKGVYATGSDVLDKGKDSATAAQIAAARNAANAVKIGGELAQTTAAIRTAQADVDAAKKGTVEYYRALGQLYQAQQQQRDAILQYRKVQYQVARDISDPVAAAIIDTKIAEAKLLQDQKLKKAPDVIASDQLALKQARQAQEQAAFSQRLSDTQTLDQLGRITSETYIAYLQREHDRLSAIKSKSRQQVDQLNQVDQALQSAFDKLDQVLRVRFSLVNDITNPTVTAAIDVELAKLKLARDQKSGVGVDQLDADRLALQQAQNSAEASAFSQRLSDVQTAEQLGRISHQAYINYLQSEHDRLSNISDKSRQQIDQLNQIDQALKSASDTMQGQFNIGDIKIPTPYEVRRFLTTQAAGVNYQGAAGNVTTIYIDGTDVGMVQRTLNAALGTPTTTRVVTTTRKVGAA